MEEIRRSGNYGKSSWDSSYIQRLTTPYGGVEFVEKAEKLKDHLKIMIEGTTNDHVLELIDDLQRLDVAHYFVDSVQNLLETIYADDKDMKMDLHATALKFRLLRQHGYHVYQEVFSCFMDESGNFKESLGDDVKGLLSLYEASFLSMENEPILDSAKDFSTQHLVKKLEEFTTDPSLAKQIRHALEIPPFKSFGVTALNLVRMSLSFYLNYGDGFGVNPNSETKKSLVSLIVDPIPMAST